MEFTKSLLKGKFIKRYKRFFVDVNLNKEIVTAHCPNTGSMKGLLDEGNEVHLFKHDDPKRKLKYGLEIIKAKKNFVGINTHRANKIVHHGLNNNLIKEFKNSDKIVGTKCTYHPPFLRNTIKVPGILTLNVNIRFEYRILIWNIDIKH